MIEEVSEMIHARGWLYLPIEVKVRELDAKLLLAYYAVKEGYHVILGEHKMVELAAEKYPPGIFFSKGYPQSYRKRIISKANKNGHSIVELDEEGLIINNPSQYMYDRMQLESLNLVSQEYCWGKVQKEVITGTHQNSEHKCHITGNPRLDILKPKFNSLYKDNAEHLRKEFGEFILINTRFSRHNSLLGKIENDEQSKYIKKLYHSFLEMITSLAELYPSTNIVIRPHPGENFESYRREFSSFDHIHVIHEGNIINWLMAAKVVIHNGCTTSIEAFLLGVPIITYKPISSAAFDVKLPNKLGVIAKNSNEITTLLEEIITKPKQGIYKDSKQNEQYLMKYCEWSKSTYSYETILGLLNNITLPPVRKTIATQSHNLYLKENKNVQHFFPFLSREEIVNFYKKLDKIEGYQSRLMINKVGKNLFEIRL